MRCLKSSFRETEDMGGALIHRTSVLRGRSMWGRSADHAGRPSDDMSSGERGGQTHGQSALVLWVPEWCTGLRCLPLACALATLTTAVPPYPATRACLTHAGLDSADSVGQRINSTYFRKELQGPRRNCCLAPHWGSWTIHQSGSQGNKPCWLWPQSLW